MHNSPWKQQRSEYIFQGDLKLRPVYPSMSNPFTWAQSMLTLVYWKQLDSNETHCQYQRSSLNVCLGREFDSRTPPDDTKRPRVQKHPFFSFHVRSHGCRHNWTRLRRALFCAGFAWASKNIAWPCWIEHLRADWCSGNEGPQVLVAPHLSQATVGRALPKTRLNCRSGLHGWDLLYCLHGQSSTLRARSGARARVAPLCLFLLAYDCVVDAGLESPS